MYYRYECIMKDQPDIHQGILTIIDDIFPDRDILYYGWPFERYLHAADCTMSDTISYFTEKGNRKLNKAIRALCKAIEATGKATTRKIILDKLDESMVLYRDKYQVVLLREEGK